MHCKNCQIEIADQAIVCFRCGTSTSEISIGDSGNGRSEKKFPTSLILFLFLLLAVTWFVGLSLSGEVVKPAVWLIFVFAGVLLIFRLKL